jgi:multiple sugar transport system substrate-binding protein
VLRPIFHNVSLFQRAGVKLPPGDWNAGGWIYDTFLEVARQVSREAAAGGPWAALLTSTLPSWSTWGASNRRALVSEDFKTCLLDQPRAVEALQYLKDIVRRHHVHPTPQEIAKEGGDQAAFQNGRTAMFEGVSGTTGLFRRITSFAWDVTHVPVSKGSKVAGGGTGWVLPAAGQHQNEAWKLLKFLSSKDMVLAVTRDGGVSSAGLGDALPRCAGPAPAAEHAHLGRRRPVREGAALVAALGGGQS